MNLEKLEKQAKTEWEALEVERNKLIDYCKLNGYEDYLIIPSVNWNNEITFNIQHKDFNWTNFVTVRIEKGKFTFSHGSGGWNDITVEEQLKATRDIFDIVEVLYQKQKELISLADEISKVRSVFEKTTNRLNEARKLLAIETATKTLLETHKPISTSEIMAKLEGGGQVYVTTLYVDNTSDHKSKTYEHLVENRGTKRANYYYLNDHYKKENLINSLDNNNYYIEK